MKENSKMEYSLKKKKRKNKEKTNATPQGCTFNNKSRWMINRLIVLGEQSVVTIVACKRGFKRGWGCRSVAERAVRSPSGCPERGDYLSRRINQFEICSHATDRAVERAHRFFLPLRSFHHQPMFQTQFHRHQRASRSMIPSRSSSLISGTRACHCHERNVETFQISAISTQRRQDSLSNRVQRLYRERKCRKVLWVLVRLCRAFVIWIFFLNEYFVHFVCVCVCV